MIQDVYGTIDHFARCLWKTMEGKLAIDQLLLDEKNVAATARDQEIADARHLGRVETCEALVDDFHSIGPLVMEGSGMSKRSYNKLRRLGLESKPPVEKGPLGIVQ